MRSLRVRLLTVVAVALVPALIFQIFTSRQALQARHLQVQDNALQVVALVSAAAQEVVAGAEQVLTTLSATPAMRDDLADTCKRLVRNLAELSPRYRSFAVFGPDGHPKCAPQPYDPDTTVSDRPYFREALATNGFVVGDYTTSRISRQPAIQVAQPYRSSQGTVAGVVQLELNLQWFGQMLADMPLPDGAIATIVDRHGIILARSRDSAQSVGQPIQAEARAILDATGPGVVPQLTGEGESRLLAYTPIGTGPRKLLVTVDVDAEAAFMPIDQAARVQRYMMLAAAAFALGLTVLFSNRLIGRPIGQLLRAVDRWRAGDLTTRVDMPRDATELGRLAAALEDMAAMLHEREKVLHTALESTPDAVIVFDRDWRYTYTNANARALTGQDLIGKVIWEEFPKTIGTPLHAAFLKAVATGQPVQADVYTVTLQRHLQTNAYPSEAGLTVFCRDLTEQRRLQAALAESEALFRAAFDQAAVGMVLADANHAAIRVNDKFCEIVGYSREELIGRLPEDFTHPEDLDRDRQRKAAVAAGHEATLGISKRYVRKDGSVVWVKLVGTPLHDADGGPVRFFAVVEDVTEQVAVAAKLRQSEEQLRLAMEAARLGVRERDLLTDAVTWTIEAETIFGVDYIGGPVLEHWLTGVHPDDRTSIRALWDHALSAPGPAFEVEYRFRKPDGGWRWVNSHMQVLFRDGRAARSVTVDQDISARKSAEAVLAQATALLRAVGNSSADAIYAKDAEGRFVYANPALLAILGKDREAVIGQTDADLLSDPVEAGAIMALDRRIIETGRTEVIQETVHTADVGTRVFRSAKSPLRLDDGTLVGIVGVSSDITDLKNAEDELRRLGAMLEIRVQEEVAAREAAQIRAAQAERMQALGQLAGGIAHDFNNVLQAISGAVALMARRPDDKAGVRRMIQLATEATERGASITRRLLAFGRRADLRSASIDAAALLNDLREILVHSLGASIDVHVRLGAELRPFLGDKSQLETTLINLSTNARDAMPGGGTLVLSATTETVTPGLHPHPDGLDPGRYVRLSVADTGVGMDAATLARASEPFFTTKSVGQGTGLGLAMSKGFAEQSGGGMLVESKVGEGTIVTLWLPATEPPEMCDGAGVQGAADDARTREDGLTTKVRVLLVEDQDPVREVLAMRLRDAGYAVLAVAGGTEALGLLAAGEVVDAVVTDLSMPGMDGLAVIRAVQARFAHIPAVLLTGYAGEGAALAVGEAVKGGFSLLRKPVVGMQLIDCLSALLAGQSEVAR